MYSISGADCQRCTCYHSFGTQWKNPALSPVCHNLVSNQLASIWYVCSIFHVTNGSCHGKSHTAT